MPFTQLALQLMADGHRVRLATHTCFKDYIQEQPRVYASTHSTLKGSKSEPQGRKIEYFPLAGDPVKLSEFMVSDCILCDWS